MAYEEILQEAGLNSWESKTYIALLELGSTTTGPLVKKCGVPQSKIYSVLESLNNKGLVTYIIKGKTKYFQASKPETIHSIIKDRERKIKEIIPKLKQLELLARHKQDVELYEGMASITKLFLTLLEDTKKGEDWLSFSIGEDEKLEKVQLFWNKIGILRYEKQLNTKIMTPKKFKKMYETAFKDRIKFMKKILRYSDRVFPATTVILKDKIIILNFLSEIETAVVITSKDLTKFYKAFYIQEWDAGKGY